MIFYRRSRSDPLGGLGVWGQKAKLQLFQNIVMLLVFVALRPKSTAMVIAGRSVHLTTLFPGQA